MNAPLNVPAAKALVPHCVVLFPLIITLMSRGPVFAQTWTNTQGGSWTVASNWDPNGIPGPDAGEIILPDYGSSQTVVYGGSLAIGLNSGTNLLAVYCRLVTTGGTIGSGPASVDNRVEVVGPGTWNNGGAMVVGADGSDNAVVMIVDYDGSGVQQDVHVTANSVTIGNSSGANNNSLHASSYPSGVNLAVDGAVVVGNRGSSNSLSIYGVLSSGSVVIGQGVSASGNTFDVGGTWNNSGTIVIGDEGSDNGLGGVSVYGIPYSCSVSCESVTIGRAVTANGNSAWFDGRWNIFNDVVVGHAGSQNVLGVGGGFGNSSVTVSGNVVIGKSVGSNTNWLFMGGFPGEADTLAVTGEIVIGDQSSGNNLRVTGGGSLSCGTAVIGRAAGANGNQASVVATTIVSPLALWRISGSLAVGPGGGSNSLVVGGACTSRVECATYCQGPHSALVLYAYSPGLVSGLLVITNEAAIDGDVNFQPHEMFVTPPIGTSLAPIRWGGRTGKFRNFSGLALRNGVLLHPEYQTNGLLLSAKAVTPLAQCGGRPTNWSACQSYHWGGEHYATQVSIPKKPCGSICEWGCGLTCLCMALLHEGVTNILGLATDPGVLNEFMQTSSGDYDPSSGVVFGKTVTDVSKAKHLKLRWRGDYFQSNDVAHLCLALGSGHPVIVRVPPSSNKQSNKLGHFVLVTGAFPQSDGSTNFNIVDPAGGVTGLLLGQTNYRKFSIRGWIEDPEGDMSLTTIEAPTNVDLLVTDSSGRGTGRDLATGQIVQDIPQSTYSDDDITDDDGDESLTVGGGHTIEISQPGQGVYLLTLTNLQTGPYSLKVYSYTPAGDPNPPLSFSGFAMQGSISTVAVPVGTSLSVSFGGETSIVLRLATDTGLNFNVEVSTDLTNWTLWQSLSPTNGFAEMVDNFTPTQRTRFYRAVSQ